VGVASHDPLNLNRLVPAEGAERGPILPWACPVPCVMRALA